MGCREVQHAFNAELCLLANRRIERDFARAGFQSVQHTAQTIHGHPGAMGTALAGCAVTGRRCLKNRFVLCQLLHTVEKPLVGGHDVRVGAAVHHRLQQFGRGADHIGQRYHAGRRFGMHQHHRLGHLSLHHAQLFGFKFVVHDAITLPQQHVGLGLRLDVVAKMAIGGPEYFFSLGMQVAHDLQCTGAGHHPVGAGFYGRTGVGVDHYRAVWIGIAEGVERIGWAA